MASKKKKKAPPCLTPVPATCLYETDETPKRKHHWDLDRAGFVEHPPNSGVWIGKCPRNLSMLEAEALIRGGVGFSPPNWQAAHPERIYVVHLGTVYRATITNPASPSYHGFPELPSKFPRFRELREAVLAQAEEEGAESLKSVRDWMTST